MKNLEMFINQLKFQELSDETIRAYKGDIKQMLEVVNKEEREIKPIDMLVTYCDAIKDMADTTKARKIIAIKLYFDFLKEIEVTSINPASKLKSPKISEKEVRFTPSEEEVEKMIDKSNTRMKAILATFKSTGLRFDELKNIKLMDVSDGTRLITDEITVCGKGGKTRTVYLDSTSMSLINDYLKVRKQGADTLFTTIQGNALDNSSTNISLKTLAKKVGIDRWKDMENHAMRRFFITSLWRKGINPSVIAKLSGHANAGAIALEMKHYVSVTENQLREAIQ